MKTTIFTAALVILMTLTMTSAFAKDTSESYIPNPTFKVNIFQPGTDMISFRVANPEADKVVLKIYNEDHVKVFHRVIKRKVDMSLKCDMSNCKSGIYTCVVIRNGKEESSKKLVIIN